MDKRTFVQAIVMMKHGCFYEENEGIGFFRAHSLADEKGVEHGFTARTGGVSLPPHDSLHLNFRKPHDEALVRENFNRFASAAGIGYESMVVVSYEHGNTVLKVDHQNAGQGFAKAPLPPCDGLITDDPSITLITNHADCGAFFLYDPVRRAVGLAHSGWKGTLGRIGGIMVKMMKQAYGCDPRDVIASTGPCICQSCYEVDAELASRFDDEFGHGLCTVPGKEGHAQLSIEAAQAIQLLDAGILPQNITLMEKCTFEDEKRLFSHRRDKNGTGDMAGYITITNP